MSLGVPLVWLRRNETLAFRFGRYHLAKLVIPVLSLETPCTSLSTDIEATVARLPELPTECQAAVLPSHPIETKPPRVRGWFAPVLEYCWKTGPRQLIGLRGTFADYTSKFRHEQRSLLVRKTRKFAELSGGTCEWRVFRDRDDILEFARIAASISRQTYQAGIGIGFADLKISCS